MINKRKEVANSELNFSQTASALKGLLTKHHQEKFSFSKLKILFPYLKQHPIYITIIIISSVISGIILLPVPIITQFIIDKYTSSHNIKMVLLLGLVIICLYIASLIIKTILSYVFSLLNNKLLLSIKQDLVDKIINFPLSFFTENQSGYLVSRINEINQLGSLFSLMLISLIVSGLTFICSLFILGFLSWQMLALSLLFLPIQYIIVRKFSGGMQNVSKIMMEKSAKLNMNMQEIVSGIQTVKSFATEEKEKKKLNSSMHSVYTSSLIQNIFMGVSQEIIGFVSNLSNILVLVISSYLIINGKFTIGLYVACLQFVNNILRPVQAFASSGMMMQPMIVAINRISEYFEIIGEENKTKREKRPISLNGKIIFDNVSFYYEETKSILNDVSFTINPGEKIIINGANGSGKTTLIKLLLQLHLPQKGVIMIDNFDVNTIDLSILRKKIGLVSQDVFLFNDTIKNNLVYGSDNITDIELKKITNKFCPFIYNFPDGINTLVGENGNNLSGGQKQSISIVRTILKHSDILIFDEGNTNLDNMSRIELIDLVNEYFSNKTCIFITHGDFNFNTPVRILTIINTSII